MIEYLFYIIWFGILAAGVIALLVTKLKSDRIKELELSIGKLKRSLDEMDEQAKLIVRTDIELNKLQEELDKKITGLYTLQKISRSISATFEEEEVFRRIEASHIHDLGFQKATAFLWKEAKFIPHLTIGYSPEELEVIKTQVELDSKFYLDLIKSEKTVSSISKALPTEQISKINDIFMVNCFVISSLLPKEGNKGFFFVGTEVMNSSVTAGDEELITILGNHIGQTLENARLFEKTWRAHQELEEKVNERTQALTQALEEVKEINRRKTEFISSVSHELRTPLTSIKGYAAILIAEKLGVLPPAVKERLEKINHHSDELVHLVNDLLDIARIESGRATLTIAEQDLRDIISTVSDLILIQCKNKNIELIVNVQKNIPLVLVDRNQIERVFINLLGNATKFTPPSGKITIEAHSKNKTVQIDISDTGIGIPAESIPNLFHEFCRVDNPINQQVKGTGLGLAMVKNIVEAHKGKVWVESNINKGSTFSFTLPAK